MDRAPGSGGRRFCDETSPYGTLDGLIGAHGNAGFIVFDVAAMRSPADLAARYRDSYKQVWPDHPPFRSRNYNADIVDEIVATGRICKAGTLGQLAATMGVDPAVFVGEMTRYNAHVDAGEDRDYGKSGRFLLSLSTAPYYAAAVQPTVNVTACGLRIDETARVLDSCGAEIRGLYAAGKCTGGVVGTRYMGSGNGLASALTMGRIAGGSAGRSTFGNAV